MALYIPEQGDIIVISLDPQAGHEQKGRRPALVVSNKTYNKFTHAAMVCPITNTDRGVAIHIGLDERTKTTGVVMCDQIKALDITKRGATFIEKLPQELLLEVIDIVAGFTEFEGIATDPNID